MPASAFRCPSRSPSRRAVFPLLTLIAANLFGSAGVFAAAPGNDPAALARVRDTALHSDYAYQRLEDLTDLVGPRLSGSPGAAASATWVTAAAAPGEPLRRGPTRSVKSSRRW